MPSPDLISLCGRVKALKTLELRDPYDFHALYAISENKPLWMTLENLSLNGIAVALGQDAQSRFITILTRCKGFRCLTLTSSGFREDKFFEGLSDVFSRLSPEHHFWKTIEFICLERQWIKKETLLALLERPKNCRIVVQIIDCGISLDALAELPEDHPAWSNIPFFKDLLPDEKTIRICRKKALHPERLPRVED